MEVKDAYRVTVVTTWLEESGKRTKTLVFVFDTEDEAKRTSKAEKSKIGPTMDRFGPSARIKCTIDKVQILSVGCKSVVVHAL